ncbi:MAG: hypothetical protein A2284_02090 [Deltaproteobacteria bacterium RIFOXYA12_FULL_61_11]|nr:MAG: hypothetical protein A2284_02090 [Deltaproteobacteria bacterium RIFOXYA12_FULL_61_11]
MQAYALNTWSIMLELAPPMLLGLFLAGLLHVLLPPSLIRANLSRPGLPSILRAVLLGIPMPLCSCGVVPTAMGLRNAGASRGAAIGFLISTPQTGVDSILVSASFLGWPFALFKVFAAFVTGLLGGLLAERFGGNSTQELPVSCPLPPVSSHSRGIPKLLEALRYALFDILAAIDLWLLGGVLAAAAITTLLPPQLLAGTTWATGPTGLLLVLLLSIPLYVCTTSSVPIAAALVAAGLPTGTALVFLMAGPATNIATLGIIGRVLGPRILAIYLGTVAGMSLLLGIAFDWILPRANEVQHLHQGLHHSGFLSLLSALLLLALLVYLLGLRILRRVRFPRSSSLLAPSNERLVLTVTGMSCHRCVANLRQQVGSLPGIQEVDIELTSGRVEVHGKNLDRALLEATIQRAGYQVAVWQA